MSDKEIRLEGFIRLNSDGLRKLCASLDFVYGHDAILNLSLWSDGTTIKQNEIESKKLFLQVERNSGEIDLVTIERDDS